MSVLRTCKITLLCQLLLFGGAAHALDLAGFASLGVGRIDRDDTMVLELDDRWSGTSNSILGAQINHSFSGQVSATAQVVSRGVVNDDTNKFEPTVDWFFLSYQYAAPTRFRIGRMRNPLFMFSEILSVGYSYTWVRPPIDVYDPYLQIFADLDGVDVRQLIDVGGNEVELSFYVGESEGERSGFTIDADLTLGFAMTLRKEDYQIRYGLSGARADQEISSIKRLGEAYDNFALLHPMFSEVSEAQQVEDGWYLYHTLGGQLDRGNWSYITELNWIMAPDSGFSADKLGWYFSISRQIEEFRPYVVLGYSNYDISNDDGLDIVKQSELVVPSGLSPELDALRQITYESYAETNRHGFSTTIGCRYDFHESAALKFEFQYFNSSIPVIDFTPEPNSKDIYINSIVLEMIF